MRITAQAVVDRLVLQEGVEDEGSRAQSGGEGCRDGPSRRPAHVAGRVLQAGQPLFERGPLSVQLDLQRGAQLLEETGPGRPPRHRLLGEDALLGLGQEVLAVAPERDEMMAAEREAGVGQQLLHPVLGQRRPLQVEEDQLGLHPGAALLHPLHERPGCGVGGVAREPQPGVGLGLAQHLAQISQGRHELGQAGGVEVADLAPVGRQLGRPAVGLVQQPGDGRISPPVDQVPQVPGDGGHVLGDGHPLRLLSSQAPRGAQTEVNGWRGSVTSSRPGGRPSTLTPPSVTSTETRPPARGMRFTRR